MFNFNYFILKLLFILSLICLAQASFMGFLVALQISLGSVCFFLLKGEFEYDRS